MELKSKNPFLNNKSYTTATKTNVFDADGRPINIIDYNNTMSVQGAINKSFILFALLLCGAGVTWSMAFAGQNPIVLTIAGAIIGLILVLAASFSPKNSRFLAPGYAFFEGLFIGGLSAIFEVRYPGLVMKAVAGTMVTFGVCLALYRFGVVKVTERFKSVVIASTLAIATYYFISMLFYWIGGISFFHTGNSLPSIGFSVFVVVLAALNLFLDFDQIEEGAQRRLPKYMEWFGAMGLIITLVWLYVEFLRLLSKLQSRD
ncbi:hypothetical protein GR160_09115 [Flavobacterium sp. Sd200]|uniref:Bax inhibitor-1/YccA family protein n=1 Tax=Flavobacterium sp. Sd200 TaxID=2692211 RepID=UPI001367B1F2|nr:Bax inhibitor-1/YccA family protein [Flavobacterium sp. Sd200]MXN91388.1 hypothetical protein [Flavobacterium sp. Sd200]